MTASALREWWHSPLAARAQQRSTIVLVNSKGRIQRITTVAVARKLLIALWALSQDRSGA
jgi:hypothetical protein